jgi:uncharacterized protein
MNPELGDEEYIFHTTDMSLEKAVTLKPWAIITEKEGFSLILEKKVAERNRIIFAGVYKRITLNVHSSLDAYGLTAAISTKLADSRISANVIAAYYHDHVFVQSGKAEEALKLLKEMMR